MKKFIFILNCIFAIIAVVFSILFWITDFLILFVYLAVISVILTSIFRLISTRISKISFKKIFFSTFLRLWAFIGIIFTFFIIFIFYNNRINPGVSPNIVVQNSLWQEIVFVNMSHIATEDFYNQKNNSLKNFSNSGFVFLVEGVGTWTTESHEIFNQNLGFTFNEDLYPNIAKIMDLSAQDEKIFDWIESEKLISIDMKMDEIAELLGPSENIATPENIDFNEFFNVFDNFSDFQKFAFRQSLYSIMNLSLRLSNFESLMQKIPESQKKLFDIILNTRNKKVLDYIISHPEQKIAIVYGALHFEGIFAELLKNDNSWKIISVEKFFPYSQY